MAVSGSEERKSFVVERKKIRPSVAARKQRRREKELEIGHTLQSHAFTAYFFIPTFPHSPLSYELNKGLLY